MNQSSQQAAMMARAIRNSRRPLRSSRQWIVVQDHDNDDDRAEVMREHRTDPRDDQQALAVPPIGI
ncbi:MAG: hypothetical protein OXG02_08370 [Chloroflexi bacterium]|nr:hypothetical protein [Chloroflexota bacterium]